MEAGAVAAAIPGIAVKAVSCIANDEPTADCRWICRCDDGSDYAIKDATNHLAIPHAEWFATRLGEIVGVACPPCRVVDVQGAACFGSRWETGNGGFDWWIRASRGEIDFSLLAPTLSRILAFDLFVHNGDRHLRNYIVREQRMGAAVLAFDFGRSWNWNSFPLPVLPMTADAMTIQAHRFLKQNFGKFLVNTEIDHVLNNLRSVSAVRAETIILEHPKHWLTDSERNTILDWWNSRGRLDRIDQIEEGIRNESYL